MIVREKRQELDAKFICGLYTGAMPDQRKTLILPYCPKKYGAEL